MKSLIFLIVFAGLLFSLSGCYQAHSGDDLRTVPATNNPNIIMRERNPSVPGANF